LCLRGDGKFFSMKKVKLTNFCLRQAFLHKYGIGFVFQITDLCIWGLTHKHHYTQNETKIDSKMDAKIGNKRGTKSFQ
jgi:hypothetical protein